MHTPFFLQSLSSHLIHQRRHKLSQLLHYFYFFLQQWCTIITFYTASSLAGSKITTEFFLEDLGNYQYVVYQKHDDTIIVIGYFIIYIRRVFTLFLFLGLSHFISQ